VAEYGHPSKETYLAALRALPLSQLLGAFRPLDPRPPALRKAPPASYDDPVVIDRVIARYLATRRVAEAIARAHGARTAFVWQPVPTYRYQPARADYRASAAGIEYTTYGYRRMADLAASRDMGNDFLWCAEVHTGVPGVLYIDKVHYSPRMSDLVAGCIADLLDQRRLLAAADAGAGDH
jgi:hypothetical protein